VVEASFGGVFFEKIAEMICRGHLILLWHEASAHPRRAEISKVATIRYTYASKLKRGTPIEC
jgi:hypothetical protein